jgi:hypothetical protein
MRLFNAAVSEYQQNSYTCETILFDRHKHVYYYHRRSCRRCP